jgi:DNA-binding MarR family transcriptional regulator
MKHKINKDEAIMETMMHVGRIVRNSMHISSSIAELTLLQLETLIYLARNPQVHMVEVANYFHITKPTATSMLNKLVSLKLVKRDENKLDRRVVRVNLSELGKNLLEETQKKKKEKFTAILAELSQEDKEHLLRITNTIFETAKKVYEK